MVFWDWLRPTPAPAPQADRIWLTRTAKLAGLATEVSDAAGPVLVLAHFPQTLREVREALTAVGFPGADFQGPLAVRDLRSRRQTLDKPVPLFALVSQLCPADGPVDPGDETPTRVLVAERHFLRSRDDDVSRFAEGLGPRPVTFFLSLDEPLFQASAGPWVTDVLRKLGMKETDAIESNMILRQVRRAQGKFGCHLEGDEPADSPEEWLARNRVG